jgi:hypothetical protein
MKTVKTNSKLPVLTFDMASTETSGRFALLKKAIAAVYPKLDDLDIGNLAIDLMEQAHKVIAHRG